LILDTKGRQHVVSPGQSACGGLTWISQALGLQHDLELHRSRHGVKCSLKLSLPAVRGATPAGTRCRSWHRAPGDRHPPNRRTRLHRAPARYLRQPRRKV